VSHLFWQLTIDHEIMGPNPEAALHHYRMKKLQKWQLAVQWWHSLLTPDPDINGLNPGITQQQGEMVVIKSHSGHLQLNS
jgi:hypothetical protein